MIGRLTLKPGVSLGCPYCSDDVRSRSGQGEELLIRELSGGFLAR